MWFTRDSVSIYTTPKTAKIWILRNCWWHEKCWTNTSRKQTFFRKAISERFDQSLEEEIPVDATAISTPLDSVPLYTVQSSRVLIILLKSSHAVSSSVRFSFGTPSFQINTWFISHIGSKGIILIFSSLDHLSQQWRRWDNLGPANEEWGMTRWYQLIFKKFEQNSTK